MANASLSRSLKEGPDSLGAIFSCIGTWLNTDHIFLCAVKSRGTLAKVIRSTVELLQSEPSHV